MKTGAIVLNRSLQVSLNEICELCRINHDEVFEMIEEGIIDPHAKSRSDWQFHGYDVQRIQIVVRLKKDLQVNLPGAAVILNLLEEIDELKKGKKMNLPSTHQ